MAHTPGPWILDDAAAEGAVYCSDATGSIVARTTGVGFEYARRPSEEWTANARLIAAAPELFAALKALVEASECSTDDADIWIAASAAIAKAELIAASHGVRPAEERK